MNAKEVHHWSGLYPVAYDTLNYDPFIVAARAGDEVALRRVTEWKNPGRGNPPSRMRLSANKEQAFQHFLAGLPRYLGPNGSALLRADFPVNSPIYAIFWHHVLFGTPIFDLHTNRAYHFYTIGRLLRGRGATIHGGGHWVLFDLYANWFQELLGRLQVVDPTITERQLDRALIQWGMAHR